MSLMKSLSSSLGLLCLVALAASESRGEEARAMVYVVDRAPEFAGMEGACVPYGPAEATGKDREILAIAKAPAGSTVLMIAFDRDLPHLGLAPAFAEQTEDSRPLRFPVEGAKWPYDDAAPPVDLYVAVFAKGDPNLERLSEYVEWMGEALADKDPETAALHALAIKNRLSQLLRQRSAEDYRAKYSDPITDAIRLAPSSKAAVTRGTTGLAPEAAVRAPKSPVAAVRRGLKTLDSEWREDARLIPYSPASPGLFVFPVTTPAAP